MRKTNKVYLVTWSYPGVAWNVVRAIDYAIKIVKGGGVK